MGFYRIPLFLPCLSLPLSPVALSFFFDHWLRETACIHELDKRALVRRAGV